MGAILLITWCPLSLVTSTVLKGTSTRSRRVESSLSPVQPLHDSIAAIMGTQLGVVKYPDGTLIMVIVQLLFVSLRESSRPDTNN